MSSIKTTLIAGRLGGVIAKLILLDDRVGRAGFQKEQKPLLYPYVTVPPPLLGDYVLLKREILLPSEQNLKKLIKTSSSSYKTGSAIQSKISNDASPRLRKILKARPMSMSDSLNFIRTNQHFSTDELLSYELV
jgi:hypothetical protein